MKMYFETPTRGHDDDGLPSITAKMNPFGPDWIERKKLRRPDDPSGYNVFGAEAYRYAQIVQREGEEYRLRAEHWAPEVMEEWVRRAKRRLPSKLAELQRQLKVTAVDRPELVAGLFCRYLEQSEDIDRDIRELGFDDDAFAYDEGDVDMVEQIGVSAAAFPKEFAERRRAFIANEIAEICSDQYADGVGRPWKNEPIFIRIITHHFKEEIEKEAKMQEKLPEYRTKFEHIMREKGFTHYVSEDVMRERLDSVQVELLDALTASFSERYGDYQPESHVVRIASELSDQLFWGVYVHEMLHALSGKVERVDSVPEYPELDMTHTLRNGLHFLPPFLGDEARPSQKRPRFAWLDEAMTEYTTLEFTGTRDHGIYKHERELFEMLIRAADIPSFDVYAAYFENFNGERLPSHPMPAVKRLFDALNKKMGKRFLVDLDLVIRMHGQKKRGGARAMVARWRKLDDAFPEYVRQRAEGIRERLARS